MVREMEGIMVCAATGLTMRAKLAEADAPLRSVAVMEKVVAASGTVGVPEIVPLGDMPKPVGKAGLIARVS
jgi:hypothetical protein